MGVLSDRSALIASRPVFEKLYCDYNKREYVSPDPLQFLYDYESPADREVVGLIASSLAYGKVAQILKSVQRVLSVLGRTPAQFLINTETAELENKLAGFVHRFTDEHEIVSFLCCIKGILKRKGTLESLFISYYNGDTWTAVEKFVSELMACGGRENMFLLPRPSKGSACKRLALFLRWMVRCDEVDPGGWHKITPDALFVPLDTHMYQICSTLGLCTHKSADGNAVREITEAFCLIRPDDPVRYDFAMTRFGIRSEMTHEELFAKWSKAD
jgi:uncharacterized protein (TIGR02757 family)